MDVFIAGAVFLVAYALIASERLDRTVIALLGGLLVVVLGVVDQEEAFAAIDFNVIFLLAGMMVLAGGLSKTGFFEYVAGYAIHLSRGQPFRLLIILSILTALLAAVLDNVTTVVLLTPVTLSIARTLKVNPFPYLISQIFASNIGGTATLIGDPPNILIGSAAGLDFGDFLVNLAPVVVVIMVAFVGIMWLAFGRNMEDDADRLDVLATVDPAAAIKDRPLMIRALIVLGLTLIGFLFHSVLGLEAATIALLGATVLMLVGPLDPHEALTRHRVEHAVLLRRAVHADLRGRPRRDHRGHRGCPCRGGGRGSDRRHARDSLVLGARVGHRRQHPLHRDRHPGRPAAGRYRPRG